MSDELNLPDELRACEARLAAKTLPATSIDRDQLMYRAGWAAGAETCNRARSTNVDRAQGVSLGRALALCSSSAALAASVAVAITLQWRPQASRDTLAVAHRMDQTPAVAVSETRVDASSARPASAPNNPSAAELLLTKLASGTRQPSSPLFAQLVHQRTVGDERPIFAADANNNSPTAQAKTARQLLDEILPHGRPDVEQRTLFRAWPWSGINIGETI